MFVLGVKPADLLGCRFAVSPLFELGSAIRTTHRTAGQRWHPPLLDQVMWQAPPEGLAVLQAMQPTRGYTPDFLAPTPSSPGTTVRDEVYRVGQTPLEQVAHELQLCRADHGVTHVLQDLHPDVRYQDETIQIDWRHPAVQQYRDVDGAGLVLMPSAFTWPQPLAVLDPPWQPTVVYPARGVAALWDRPAPDATAALTAVLGRTRARLLDDLAEPDDTTSLAERYNMAPSSLSRHLQALHRAGLLRARRQQRCVLYQRTALGTALVRATAPEFGEDR